MGNSTIQHQLETALSAVIQSIEHSLATSTIKADTDLLLLLKKTQVDRWPELLESYYPRHLLHHKESLSAVLATLSQLSVGLYGSCARCDGPIEQDILSQRATAQYCQHCSAELAKSR